MRFLLFGLALSLAACSMPPRPVTTSRSTVSYLTRIAPEAALDSVAAWASGAEAIVAQRDAGALILRDGVAGENNVARVTARSRPDGITEVTAASEYVVTSPESFRNLAASAYMGQSRTDPFLLADASGERCTSEADWLDAEPPAPPSTPTPPQQIEETPPELIGGLAGLSQRVKYPESSRRADIQGIAYVRFVVSTTGAVECVQVFGAPDRAIAEAAREAVAASAFVPGTQKGEPVRVRFTLPIQFMLR
ncbi:TonB family protein [Rubricoccus marinus]|uniref:TonB C-terminal domain-containing protein n=1 Tax=Rubricoccus marinus TaxID=716817 RepID=A0A259TX42_9BACT|nr:TonB family protein [Rubricoccus marinus]OZC02342.1 hypothetical protein BSZ36_04735 [Rubricoccus marinus]